MRKTAFIGHRQIFQNNLEEKLRLAIEQQIQSGCIHFIVGSHGEFDRIALSACRTLREKYPEIIIEVVITSLCAVNAHDSKQKYDDISTVIYEIEDVYYKRRITLSNQKMIDECDTLICYVNEKACQSGAKTALRYAQRKGVQVLNLWPHNENNAVQ